MNSITLSPSLFSFFFFKKRKIIYKTTTVGSQEYSYPWGLGLSRDSGDTAQHTATKTATT